MGPIASFINGLDKAAEKEDAAKKALEIGIKMIQNRFAIFEANLNLPVGAVKKVPAQYVIASKRIISCNVSQGSQGNKEAIQGIVNDFANGQTGKGIVNTLFTGLDMIMGTFSASYNEAQDYMVLTNLIGGVYRIDYLVISQKIQGKGFSEKISSVFGSYLIITSINKKELQTDNVYKILVDRQFPERTVYIKFILVKLLKEEELTPEEVDAIGNIKYDDLQFDEQGELLKKGQDGKYLQRAYPDKVKPEVPLDLSTIQLPSEQDIKKMSPQKLEQVFKTHQKVKKYLQRALKRALKDQKDMEDEIEDNKKKLESLSQDLQQNNNYEKKLELMLRKEKNTQDVKKLAKNLGQMTLKKEEINQLRKALEKMEKQSEQE